MSDTKRNTQLAIIQLIERQMMFLNALRIAFDLKKTVRQFFLNDIRAVDGMIAEYTELLKNEKTIQKIGYEAYIKKDK